jgi:spore coat protein A
MKLLAVKLSIMLLSTFGVSSQDSMNMMNMNDSMQSSMNTSSSAQDSMNGNLRGTGDRKIPLEPGNIPKFVMDLWIPHVLYDDQHDTGMFNISVRQIKQRILPHPYPKTTVWAYGRPDDPKSYHHPASSVEVTQNKMTTVKWINELVLHPEKCSEQWEKYENPKGYSCNFVPPLFPNEQNLHWANVPQTCSDGSKKTNCNGPKGLEPYEGPIPMITHLHGTNAPPQYDGYAEAWWLPRANNIPDGYATLGSKYGGPIGDRVAGETTGNPGYGIFEYPNNQVTTSLWFHDHTLGMTLNTAFSMGFGYWFIRTKDDGEDSLESEDCNGMHQSLPGPPALKGQDPNNDLSVRCKIREIPLSFQVRSFYKDGSIYARPLLGSMVPDWEFDVMSVNGNSWPKLNVAQDRYRFRLLNGSGLRELLGLYMIYKDESGMEHELPFHVIGSDQGMLPQVAIVKRNYAALIDGCDMAQTASTSSPSGLLLSPGERMDVIVDFSNLPSGTIVELKNSNPINPNPLPSLESVMRFIVTEDLCGDQSDSTMRSSTSPWNLVLAPLEKLGDVTNPKPRDIAMIDSGMVMYFGDGARTLGNQTEILFWSSPVTQNPEINATEIWVRILRAIYSAIKKVR